MGVFVPLVQWVAASSEAKNTAHESPAKDLILLLRDEGGDKREAVKLLLGCCLHGFRIELVFNPRAVGALVCATNCRFCMRC